MKDLPMFNKLFFVLCSSLLIAVSSPSAAEEPTYHTIQGSGGEYEVFGTEQEAARYAVLLVRKRKEKLKAIEKRISSGLLIQSLNPNKMRSITKDGIMRTVYCNPGPCTPGSVKLHEYITGIDMGVDVNTLAKRIETNAAQKKRQDNTNENNAKTAEDMASLGNVSVDTLFEQSEADLDKTNDTSFARAQSIPLGQRIRNKEAYTDYVRSAAENEAYCLYEGGC